MSRVEIELNGRLVSSDVEDRMLLVEYLRESRDLTGTHVGCDTSQCGACVVHVDGKAVKSCTMLAVQANGSKVTTIEGLAGDGELHPMQSAFKENHGLQCGFCTPGMIMNATGLLYENPEPSRAEIIEVMEENLCRCGSYGRIIDAIQSASKSVKGGVEL